MNKKLITLFILAAMIIAVPSMSVKADTLVWSGSVYSTGPEVSSIVSTSGVNYRIVVSEIFYPSPSHAADAMYYTTEPSTWPWNSHSPAPGGNSFLQINQQSVNWGAYNPNHVYTYYFTGNGNTIKFRIVDWVAPDVANNCHFYVEIYAPDRYYGATPGYWKQPKHFNAWPDEYTPNMELRDVFGNNAPDVTLLQALQGGGGRGIDGAKKILARAAVAAILNSESFNYKYTESWIIDQVTNQFTSGTRASILSLASDLDHWNNMGRP
jgi:hypothetical protein